MRSLSSALLVSIACAACATAPRVDPALELFEWERGIGVRALGPTPMPMYLWFYEWNLFDAFERGELSAGSYELTRTVAADGRSARIEGPGIVLDARVQAEGIELELQITNRTEHAWPAQAAIIACFNPGPKETRTFEMGHHLKTYMVGPEGLERVADRDFHFNDDLRAGLTERSPELKFAFSNRWATSPRDSHAGLLLRESFSGGWTSGVAWQEWLGLQAHNPWLCMHAATRVGPLGVGEIKTVRGMLFLFPGDRAEGLRRFQTHFDAR